MRIAGKPAMIAAKSILRERIIHGPDPPYPDRRR
jgi:hypothetical protein